MEDIAPYQPAQFGFLVCAGNVFGSVGAGFFGLFWDQASVRDLRLGGVGGGVNPG